MADPTAGVQIEIDGQTRSLRYENEYLIDLEEETGLSAQQHWTRVATAMSHKSMTALLWTALRPSIPDLTMKGTIELLDLSRTEEFTDAIASAFAKAHGLDPEKIKEEADTPGN